MKANRKGKSPQGFNKSNKPQSKEQSIVMRAPMEIPLTRRQDSTKLLYAMLKSGLFFNCELSYPNPHPTKFREGFVFPEDAWLDETVTDSNAGTFEEFVAAHTANLEASGGSFSCVCSLEHEDTERIGLYSSDGERRLTLFLTTETLDPATRLALTQDKLFSKYNEMFPR